MARSLAKHASHILNFLPAAHFITRTMPSPHLAAATAIATHPKVRRMAPGLSAVAIVGIAAFAVPGLVNGLKRRAAFRWKGGNHPQLKR
jgi:hypothetical protein